MTNGELRLHMESLHANLAQLFEQSQKHDAQIERIGQKIDQLTRLPR